MLTIIHKCAQCLTCVFYLCLVVEYAVLVCTAGQKREKKICILKSTKLRPHPHGDGFIRVDMALMWTWSESFFRAAHPDEVRTAEGEREDG